MTAKKTGNKKRVVHTRRRRASVTNKSLLASEYRGSDGAAENDSPFKLSEPRKRPEICAVQPNTNLLSRLQAFLPQLEQANQVLITGIKSDGPANYDIEHVDPSQDQVIMMKLGLGLFEGRHPAQEGDLQIPGKNRGSSSTTPKIVEMDVDESQGSLLPSSFESKDGTQAQCSHLSGADNGPQSLEEAVLGFYDDPLTESCCSGDDDDDRIAVGVDGTIIEPEKFPLASCGTSPFANEIGASPPCLRPQEGAHSFSMNAAGGC